MLSFRSSFITSSLLWKVSIRTKKVLNSHKPYDPVTPKSSSAAFLPAKKESKWSSSFSLPDSFPVAVWNDFITTDEEQEIFNILNPTLADKPYAPSHFDSVIHNYKEQLLHPLLIKEHPILNNIVDRVRNKILKDGFHLEDIHVLDIAESGFIAPHVDTEFTGGIVCGLTLLSDAVVTFQPHVQELQESLLKAQSNSNDNTHSQTKLEQNTSISFDELPRIELLVPARSLYIQTGAARYKWTHAIDKQESHTFNSVPIPRSRRISIMFRDQIPPKWAK